MNTGDTIKSFEDCWARADKIATCLGTFFQWSNDLQLSHSRNFHIVVLLISISLKSAKTEADTSWHFNTILFRLKLLTLVSKTARQKMYLQLCVFLVLGVVFSAVQGNENVPGLTKLALIQLDDEPPVEM